ncbi:hypothetical protein GPN2_22458 [Streptomyces murinus]
MSRCPRGASAARGAQAHRTVNPRRTVTSRTVGHPALSWILSEGLGFGRPPDSQPSTERARTGATVRRAAGREGP